MFNDNKNKINNNNNNNNNNNLNNNHNNKTNRNKRIQFENLKIKQTSIIHNSNKTSEVENKEFAFGSSHVGRRILVRLKVGIRIARVHRCEVW